MKRKKESSVDRRKRKCTEIEMERNANWERMERNEKKIRRALRSWKRRKIEKDTRRLEYKELCKKWGRKIMTSEMDKRSEDTKNTWWEMVKEKRGKTELEKEEEYLKCYWYISTGWRVVGKMKRINSQDEKKDKTGRNKDDDEKIENWKDCRNGFNRCFEGLGLGLEGFRFGKRGGLN